MGFYSEVVLYRPGTPPTIKSSDLAHWIEVVSDAKLLDDNGFQSLNVKFGRGINQDKKPTSWDEVTVPGIFVTRQIDWDLKLQSPTGIREIIDTLNGSPRTIYRAHVMLGDSRAICEPVTRTNSPENNIDFVPSTVAIELGPIEIGELNCDNPTFVGWIGVSISGYGYFYPWTMSDVIERLESSEAITRLSDICRTTWPVPKFSIRRASADLANRFKTFLPRQVQVPAADWTWGINETG